MTSGSPFRISDLAHELSRVDAEAQAFVAPLTDAQGNWQPGGGLQWSITQNLQHLAKTNRVYTDSMRAGLTSRTTTTVEDADLASVPGWFGRLFIWIMEPPPRFKVKTRPVVQPPSTGALQEALSDFIASQDVVRAFAREAGGDLYAKFTSPFGPVRFRVGTGLLVLAAHTRRHIWQARQVTRAPGFPAEAM
jgi:hypothetical protein